MVLDELRLNSPAGSDPAIYSWPLVCADDRNDAFEIVETIRLVCNDIPHMKTSLDSFILRDFDTSNVTFESMQELCERYNWALNDHLQRNVPSGSCNKSNRRAGVNLLKHIIQQCYNRAVVDPEKLNQYEPFSPEVYGETSFELVDQIIRTVNFKEEDRFIDLGSGVGQVVAQIAAATRCQSCFGIEKADCPAAYAKRMSGEFRRWMSFYGKEHSQFELEKGDFLSDGMKDQINNATVIFVNNFAFGPQTDHQLKLRFANLREGAKIISSKAFCPLNFHITERNLSDIGAIMTVRELSTQSGAVSWTGRPVTYYLHTIDRTALEGYFMKLRNPRLPTHDVSPVRKDRHGRVVKPLIEENQTSEISLFNKPLNRVRQRLRTKKTGFALRRSKRVSMAERMRKSSLMKETGLEDQTVVVNQRRHCRRQSVLQPIPNETNQHCKRWSLLGGRAPPLSPLPACKHRRQKSKKRVSCKSFAADNPLPTSVTTLTRSVAASEIGLSQALCFTHMPGVKARVTLSPSLSKAKTFEDGDDGASKSWKIMFVDMLREMEGDLYTAALMESLKTELDDANDGTSLFNDVSERLQARHDDNVQMLENKLSVMKSLSTCDTQSVEQKLVQGLMIEELRQIHLLSLQLELRAVKLGVQFALLSASKIVPSVCYNLGNTSLTSLFSPPTMQQKLDTVQINVPSPMATDTDIDSPKSLIVCNSSSVENSPCVSPDQCVVYNRVSSDQCADSGVSSDQCVDSNRVSSDQCVVSNGVSSDQCADSGVSSDQFDDSIQVSSDQCADSDVFSDKCVGSIRVSSDQCVDPKRYCKSELCEATESMSEMFTGVSQEDIVNSNGISDLASTTVDHTELPVSVPLSISTSLPCDSVQLQQESDLYFVANEPFKTSGEFNRREVYSPISEASEDVADCQKLVTDFGNDSEARNTQQSSCFSPISPCTSGPPPYQSAILNWTGGHYAVEMSDSSMWTGVHRTDPPYSERPTVEDEKWRSLRQVANVRTPASDAWIVSSPLLVQQFVEDGSRESLRQVENLHTSASDLSVVGRPLLVQQFVEDGSRGSLKQVEHIQTSASDSSIVDGPLHVADLCGTPVNPSAVGGSSNFQRFDDYVHRCTDSLQEQKSLKNSQLSWPQQHFRLNESSCVSANTAPLVASFPSPYQLEVCKPSNVPKLLCGNQPTSRALDYSLGENLQRVVTAAPHSQTLMEVDRAIDARKRKTVLPPGNKKRPRKIVGQPVIADSMNDFDVSNVQLMVCPSSETYKRLNFKMPNSSNGKTSVGSTGVSSTVCTGSVVSGKPCFIQTATVIGMLANPVRDNGVSQDNKICSDASPGIDRNAVYWSPYQHSHCTYRDKLGAIYNRTLDGHLTSDLERCWWPMTSTQPFLSTAPVSLLEASSNSDSRSNSCDSGFGKESNTTPSAGMKRPIVEAVSTSTVAAMSSAVFSFNSHRFNYSNNHGSCVSAVTSCDASKSAVNSDQTFSGQPFVGNGARFHEPQVVFAETSSPVVPHNFPQFQRADGNRLLNAAVAVRSGPGPMSVVSAAAANSDQCRGANNMHRQNPHRWPTCPTSSGFRHGNNLTSATNDRTSTSVRHTESAQNFSWPTNARVQQHYEYCNSQANMSTQSRQFYPESLYVKQECHWSPMTFAGSEKRQLQQNASHARGVWHNNVQHVAVLSESASQLRFQQHGNDFDSTNSRTSATTDDCKSFLSAPWNLPLQTRKAQDPLLKRDSLQSNSIYDLKVMNSNIPQTIQHTQQVNEKEYLRDFVTHSLNSTKETYAGRNHADKNCLQQAVSGVRRVDCGQPNNWLGVNYLNGQ